MDKSIRVQVKEPCHENWQNMTANEKGRFCASCQKTVVDFTLMNDRQILEHLSKANGGTCGRFANDQLERDLKAKVVKSKSRWAYFLNMLIPVLFTNLGSSTKGDAVTKGRPTMVNSANFEDDLKYSGTVGIVIIWDSTVQEEKPPATDCPARELEEEILPDTMVKFIPPIIAFDDTTSPKADTFIKGEVKIPLPENCSYGRLGGISIGTTIIEEPNSIKQFAKDTLAKLGIKRPIKAYPNPVTAGQSVTIDFSPKSLGTYNVDLFDINGRMIYSRQVNMVFEKQSFQVPTISSWSKGTYIIRITGEGKDNVHNVKVMVR